MPCSRFEWSKFYRVNKYGGNNFFFKKFGCILFRGFNFKPQTYLKFTNYFSYSYANDALRREKTAFGEYVKGVDKGSEKMNLHSEASFSPSWPEIIWFYCKISPKTYGETTICDGIKLWEDLSFETQNFFLGNPIEYHLNIPINIKKENKPTRVWQLNTVGTYDTYLDYSQGAIKTKQIRFA